MKIRRTSAAVLAWIIFAALLFSVLFIFAEADHDCAGEDCQVCVQMEVCLRTLQDLTLGLVLVLAAVIGGIFVVFLPGCVKKAAQRASLVSWKVKLSN